MPHQIIEYSANLAERIDIEDVVRALHRTALDIDVLPVGGLRTRAVGRSHYCIADEHEDNAFVNVVLRIAPGRSFEEKKTAGERLFATLCRVLAPVYESSPLAISYEIQEIDADFRWKQNNLRDYIAKRKAAAT